MRSEHSAQGQAHPVSQLTASSLSSSRRSNLHRLACLSQLGCQRTPVQVISAPTGSGKTVILELALLRLLTRHIAPTGMPITSICLYRCLQRTLANCESCTTTAGGIAVNFCIHVPCLLGCVLLLCTVLCTHDEHGVVLQESGGTGLANRRPCMWLPARLSCKSEFQIGRCASLALALLWQKAQATLISWERLRSWRLLKSLQPRRVRPLAVMHASFCHTYPLLHQARFCKHSCGKHVGLTKHAPQANRIALVAGRSLTP